MSEAPAKLLCNNEGSFGRSAKEGRSPLLAFSAPPPTSSLRRFSLPLLSAELRRFTRARHLGYDPAYRFLPLRWDERRFSGVEKTSCSLTWYLSSHAPGAMLPCATGHSLPHRRTVVMVRILPFPGLVMMVWDLILAPVAKPFLSPLRCDSLS